MEKKLLPSILSADFGHLSEHIKIVEEAGADMLHVDIMDNQFVPNLTIGPVVVKWIRKNTSLDFDVHLMTVAPETLIKPFVDAGADLLSVHYEATIHLHSTINAIRKAGAKAGIVLNPATPLCSLDEILPEVDYILLMSVNPGFAEQNFIESTKKKIAALHTILQEKGMAIPIEVDGGIKVENVKEILEAGADWIVSGSGIFSAQNPAEKVQQLKTILREFKD